MLRETECESALASAMSCGSYPKLSDLFLGRVKFRESGMEARSDIGTNHSCDLGIGVKFAKAKLWNLLFQTHLRTPKANRTE